MYKVESTAPLDTILTPAEQVRYGLGRAGLKASMSVDQGLSRDLYLDELIDWYARPEIEVMLTVDAINPGAEDVIPWQEDVGVVTQLIRRISVDAKGAVAMICGPEIMMHFAAQALLARGVPPKRIHLSMERNMKCGVGTCGHCQFGGWFICRDGPVLSYATLREPLRIREL